MTKIILLPVLAPPWGLDNLSDDGVSYLLNPPESGPGGIWFSADGTRMFASGFGVGGVWGYLLSTPWDLTSIPAPDGSYVYYDVTGTEPNTLGVHLKDDGTKMYICGNNSDAVSEFDLSLPFAGTASFVQAVSTAGTSPGEVRFSTDGSKMFTADTATNTIEQWTLTTPWSLSAVTPGTSLNLTATVNVAGLAFSTDGKKMFVTDDVLNTVREYDLSIAWDPTSQSFVQAKSIVGESIKIGVYFKTDGRKMYTAGPNSDRVRQYTAGS